MKQLIRRCNDTLNNSRLPYLANITAGIALLVSLKYDQLTHQYPRSTGDMIFAVATASFILFYGTIMLGLVEKARPQRLRDKTLANMRRAENAVAKGKREQAIRYAQALYTDNEK